MLLRRVVGGSRAGAGLGCLAGGGSGLPAPPDSSSMADGTWDRSLEAFQTIHHGRKNAAVLHEEEAPVPPSSAGPSPRLAGRHRRLPRSPFFFTVDRSAWRSPAGADRSSCAKRPAIHAPLEAHPQHGRVSRTGRLIIIDADQHACWRRRLADELIDSYLLSLLLLPGSPSAATVTTVRSAFGPASLSSDAASRNPHRRPPQNDKWTASPVRADLRILLATHRRQPPRMSDPDQRADRLREAPAQVASQLEPAAAVHIRQRLHNHTTKHFKLVDIYTR